MFVLQQVLAALAEAGSMAWEILWPLILGFALSAAIQAVVRSEQVAKLMSDDSPRALAVATGLGAASSSCSYAAVALARSLFRKGASLGSAMAFEIASTNLVVELGLILAFVLGWRFTLAEFVGGPVMIVLVALGFRLWMRGRIVDAARAQAERGIPGSMEGHAGMDMAVAGDGTLLQRLLSRAGLDSVAAYFVMDVTAVWKDIVGGLLIAGAFAAWVPTSWLQAVFFEGHPTLAAVEGPLVGPLLAVVSFVCSVGNVPLAAVLWSGGISFGGVVSFLFADLIIVPIILIYRKYYGTRAAVRISLIFYGAMVLAGYAVELLFTPLGLVPTDRTVSMLDGAPSWNYTTWLDIAFLVLAAVLVFAFVRSGGAGMLRMMGGAPSDANDHGHGAHVDAHHSRHEQHQHEPQHHETQHDEP